MANKSVPISRDILPTVEARVREVFAGQPPIYRFHTIDHTLAVVAAVREISVHEGLSEHESVVAEAAAWFHDVGYLRSLADHETMSAFSMMIFLAKLGVSLEDVQLVEDAILVTRLGSQPKNAIQRVLCDADMWHLTCEDYWKWAERLRKEWIAIQGLKMNDAEWVQNNIRFMRSVKFHTFFGRRVMGPRMDDNIRELEEKLAAMGQ